MKFHSITTTFEKYFIWYLGKNPDQDAEWDLSSKLSVYQSVAHWKPLKAFSYGPWKLWINLFDMTYCH